MLITELQSKESNIHKGAKLALLDWIIDDKVIFIDQYDKKFKIKIDYVNFISTEAYVYSDSSLEPYTSGQCGECGYYYGLVFCKCSDCDKYNIENEERCEHYNKCHCNDDNCIQCDKCHCNCEREMCGNCVNCNKSQEDRFDHDRALFNQNIIIKEFDGYINFEVFNIHPCNMCKYKGIRNCKFIFDIGIAHKGGYDLAIEIVKTTPIKFNKIQYCSENDIGLIEIDAYDVLSVRDDDVKYVKCYGFHDKQINGIIYYLEDIDVI